MKYQPFISVVIPTYNRAKILVGAIESFLTQSYPSCSYEIIIYDNNSSDATEESCVYFLENYPGRVLYYKELRQGAHFARNSAAKNARGELLYFTDDDMIADFNLLSEMVKIFAFESKVASATGRILPKWEANPPNWIVKHCSNFILSLNNPPEDFIISSRDCNIFSCHMAIRRDVFFKSGGFNPDYIGGELIGDGETGLNIKIKDFGYKFGYNGDSIIHHLIPVERMTQTYLDKRLANQGNSDSYTDYRKNQYSRFQLARKIIGHILRIARIGLRFFGNFVLGNDVWHLHRANIFYFKNRLHYDWRLMTDAGWRAMVLKINWLDE